jgi:hypothetical protein
LLALFAGDLRDELSQLGDGDEYGVLWDTIDRLPYPTERMRAQARLNVATVKRAQRLAWIAEQLATLEQVWPQGEHAHRAVRRVYKSHEAGADYYIYTADPEELVICSSAKALEFMAGAPLELPSEAAL